MKKIMKNILATIIAIFILLFSWITLTAITTKNSPVFNYNIIIVIIGCIIYIGLAILTYKKIIPKLAKNKYIQYFLFALFGIISIIVSYKLRLNPTWDMGRVFEIAKNYMENGTIVDMYLYEYQNNIAITIIDIIVLKFFHAIKFTDYITAITLFNAIVVTLTVIFLYYTVNKMYGKEKALMTLIICVLTTPLYLHSAIYYTDSMSMLACIFALFLYVNIREEQNKTKNYIMQALLGITLILCMKIKLTAIFIMIAIIMCEILNYKFKDIIKNFKIVVPSAIIFLIIYTIVINHYFINNKDKLNEYKMPVEHWLLIGSVNEGGFNQELYEYTKGYPTYDERKQADILKIKEVYKEYSIKTFIQHINKKIKFTWTDGTYFAPEKLRREPVQRCGLHELVSIDGQKTYLYKYFPQVMHVSMLIFIVINAIYIFRKKEYEKDDTFLMIAIFGLAVFLLLWENRSRYLLTYVPIMIILETNGIENISNIEFKKIKSTLKNRKEKNNEKEDR